MKSIVLKLMLLLASGLMAAPSIAQELLIGTGDVLRITVFQSPELASEVRVSELGTIGFPLVGNVAVGGLTLIGAERKLAQQLKDGGFVLKPQVNVLLVQSVSNQIAVLGEVNRPGRFPLETAGWRVSSVIAAAGGIASSGGDVVVVTGLRQGKPFRREIDLVRIFNNGNVADDLQLSGGDTLFVGRAPTFYIYGAVRTSGVFRLERGMTVMQAIAMGGGATEKASTRRISIHRREADGKPKEYAAGLDDVVERDDVINIKESVF